MKDLEIDGWIRLIAPAEMQTLHSRSCYSDPAVFFDNTGIGFLHYHLLQTKEDCPSINEILS